MANILLITQTLLSILLVIFILVQVRGTGFSRGWKGSTSFSRRGLERLIFRSTFILTLLFIVVSLLQLV